MPHNVFCCFEPKTPREPPRSQVIVLMTCSRQPMSLEQAWLITSGASASLLATMKA